MMGSQTDYIASGGGGGMGFGGNDGWLGMLLVIALLGGRGRGLFGGDDGGGATCINHGQSSIERELGMLSDNMNNRFSDMQGDFNFTNLTAGINGVSRDILQQTDSLNNATNNQTLKLIDGFTNLGNNVNNLGFQTLLGQKDINATVAQGNCQLGNLVQAGFAATNAQAAQCCCDTLRAIDSVNFNAAQNTASINNNINSGFCQTNFNGERNTNAIIQNQTANTQRLLDWLSCNELKEANARIAALEAERNKLEIIGAMKPIAPVPAYIQANPYENYLPPVRVAGAYGSFDGLCAR